MVFHLIPENKVLKNDVINAMAVGADISFDKAEKAFNAMFRIIEDQIKQGHQVQLVGFGTFSVLIRTARLGRNPRTGQSIQVPEGKTIKFTAGKGFKDAINQNSI